MSLTNYLKQSELTKILSEMSSKNDELFIMSPDEYEKYKKFMDDMGADISQITISNMNEDTIAGMSDTDRFDNNMAIQINKGVHNKLREMIEEGMEAKNWYYQISNAVYESLGEAEGALFLLLLASTSPRNMLSKNFVEASIIYKGFKDDLEENEQLVVNFIYDDSSALDFSYDEGSDHGELNLITAMRNNNMGDLGSKINNIKKSLKFYYENGGNINKTTTTEFLAKHFNPYSDTIKGIIDFEGGEILQKSKVYNFAINLLAPEYSVDIRNKKWFFVTIDTWMIRAMYPYLHEKLQTQILSHNAKYLYAQQKVMRFANEFNMEPHQVQASIWVAKLREAGRSVDTFEVGLQKKIKQLKTGNRQLGNIYGELGKVINDIYADNMDKPSGLKPQEVDSGTGFDLDDEEVPF